MDSTTDTQQNTKQQVWFITGCTSGTGLALVKALLNKSIKVAGTSRSIKKVSELDIAKNENFLALEVDIVNEQSVQQAIEKTIKHFGDLTHIVNNAGYAVMGAVEEVSDKEQRKLFDALYFGPLNVIRAALPHLRSKRYGYIFNVSSVAGFKSTKGTGAYAAGKFALTGMSEALAEDVLPFNIKVTNIILGMFSTGFKDSLEIASNPIQDYETLKTMKARQEIVKTMKSGNPDRFAEILIENSTKETLPCNLFIGTDLTFVIVEAKAKQLNEQISSQKERNTKVF